jgi:hypothetical protein
LVPLLRKILVQVPVMSLPVAGYVVPCRWPTSFSVAGRCR